MQLWLPFGPCQAPTMSEHSWCSSYDGGESYADVTAYLWLLGQQLSAGWLLASREPLVDSCWPYVAFVSSAPVYRLHHLEKAEACAHTCAQYSPTMTLPAQELCKLRAALGSRKDAALQS